jgi:leucyl/phenylalanyl-tRNA--protein transferase
MAFCSILVIDALVTEQTMPVYRIPDDPAFPDPELADRDGLLGIGGDLSADRLLLAYGNGIFPWHEQDGAPLWWSPDPRCVLFPEKLKVSQRLARRLRRPDYAVTFDRDFASVIGGCSSTPRTGQRGTWITGAFVKAYTHLHALGHAHSVEVTMDGVLAGGLYGVAVGRVFCGESMFSLRPDASKIALAHLVERLKGWGFPLIDCQIANPYLLSMGAEEVPRREFLRLLRKSRELPGHQGSWA